MRLLIVRLSAFGDIVHALPAAEDAAQHAEVHWLLDARFAFLAPILPAGVTAHALPTRQGIGAMLHKARRLRAIGWDAVLDLQGLVKSALVARIIAGRAPVWGFDARAIRERPAALLQRSVRFADTERHVVQQYRAIVAAALGRARPVDYRAPRIPHPPAGDPLVRPPYTVLALTGGWATKRWPLPHWQALAAGLAARGERVVALWGNDDERRTAEALGAGVISPPARLAIGALCATLAQARCVIGMDTGLLHLAAALGAPTITLWGPSASWRSAPQGPQHRHIESNPDCGPCFRRTCERFVCLPSIAAQEVLAAWDASILR